MKKLEISKMELIWQKETILSGKAKEKLEQIIKISNQLS